MHDRECGPYNRTVGDTAVPLLANLLTGEGDVLDLGGAEVDIRMVNSRTNEIVIDDAAAEILEIESALVRYIFTAEQVANAGAYYIWFVVKYGTDSETVPQGGRQFELILSNAA